MNSVAAPGFSPLGAPPAMSYDEALATLADFLGPKLAPPSPPPPVETRPQAVSATADARYTSEDLFEFAANSFYVPETNAPIVLEPVQKVILSCMFDLPRAKQFGCSSGFQTLFYSTVKKSGKTTIASLLARWVAERWGRMNEIYAIANDLEQARGRVYDKVLKSIQLDPRYDRRRDELPGMWDIVQREARHLPSGSILRALSGDYRGEAGSNPTATFWSELWGYTLEASQRLWDELTPVPTRPRSIRFVETYSGFQGESLLLIDQYEMATRPDRGARRLTRDDVPDWPNPGDPFELPLYVNPLARTFAYWDTGVLARRMPWQTPEYYQEQAITLRPEAFDRLHLNHWVSSVSSFLPVEWWDACRSPDVTPPTDAELEHTPVVVAADASVSGDCTAISLVRRNPLKPDDVVLARVAVWTPPPGGTINYGTTLEPTLRKWITGHIHPLSQSCESHERYDQLGPCIPVHPFNVVCLTYDMYQLHDMMMRFRDEGLVWVKNFSQGSDRMVADYQLYTFIRDRHITHYGDPTMREHIGGAAGKIAPDSNSKMRIVKKAKTSKIDGVVATSMATFECKRLML